jgi:hypothetical protein
MVGLGRDGRFGVGFLMTAGELLLMVMSGD